MNDWLSTARLPDAPSQPSNCDEAFQKELRSAGIRPIGHARCISASLPKASSNDRATKPDGLTEDADAVIEVLRSQVEAVGWTETARRSGVSRQALHRGLKNGAMSFRSLQLVADAVGVRLEATRSPAATEHG